jgi:HEAT repeat protein
MQDLKSLIQKLESSSSSARDKAALALMDIGDESAVPPLLSAISRPENINHRGTLVYALGAFNCEPFLDVLVDLALTGNFEISTGAYAIIEESAASEEALQKVRWQLQRYTRRALVEDHQKMAHEALSVLTQVADG